MATYISRKDGNWTDLSTWAMVSTASNAEFPNESSVSEPGTTWTLSTTFVPGAIEVDGIGLKFLSRTIPPLAYSGSVCLYSGSAPISGTQVNFNSSDLPPTTLTAGWLFFKFSSPVTLEPAPKSYRVALIENNAAANFSFYRSSTANDWTRFIRTTMTASVLPGSLDSVIVIGSINGNGSFTPTTVVMDNTSSNAVGYLGVCNGGTLTYATASNKNYYLRLRFTTIDSVKRSLDVYASGSLIIGTETNPIPSSSTATLEFSCSSATEFGLELRQYGTFNTYGLYKRPYKTYLVANALSASNTITVADNVEEGYWFPGDEVVISSTTRSPNETERETIQSVTSNSISFTLPLSFFHDGLSPYQAEVVNVTKNVKVKGITSGGSGYINTTNLAGYLNWQNTEFRYLGAGTAQKRGIDIFFNTLKPTCSFDAKNISCYDWLNDSVFYIYGGSNSNAGGFTMESCSFFNHYRGMFNVGATTNTHSFNEMYFGYTTDAGTTAYIPVVLGDMGCTYKNITVVSHRCRYISLTYAISVSETPSSGYFLAGSMGNFNIHSNERGMTLTLHNGIVDGIYTWRNGTLAANYGGLIVAGSSNADFNHITCSGNPGVNMSILNSSDIRFLNSKFNSHPTYSTPYGILLGSYSISPGYTVLDRVNFYNCEFGTEYSHSTGELTPATYYANQYSIYKNCRFGSNVKPITWPLGLSGVNSVNHIWFCFYNFNNEKGDHRIYTSEGTMSIDNEIYRTAAPSLRMTPNRALSTGKKLWSAPTGYGFSKRIESGSAVSASVWIRKSTDVNPSGSYGGSEVRFMLRSNSSLGYPLDTMFASSSAASIGNWEMLSANIPPVIEDGVLDFYLDCDGNSGSINVSDFSATSVIDSRNMKYWLDGLPLIDGDYGSAGGGTYINTFWGN